MKNIISIFMMLFCTNALAEQNDNDKIYFLNIERSFERLFQNSDEDNLKAQRENSEKYSLSLQIDLKSNVGQSYSKILENN